MDTVQQETCLKCPHCGAPLHTFTQEALLPTQQPHQMTECVNTDCDLWMVTLDADEFCELYA